MSTPPDFKFFQFVCKVGIPKGRGGGGGGGNHGNYENRQFCRNVDIKGFKHLQMVGKMDVLN